MKIRILTLAFLFVLSGTALAQFTVVTGTVLDPNGLAYANGTISPVLVLPGGTSPTLNGATYSPPTQPIGLDIAGKFTMRIADNNVLLPGGTTWNFTVCSAQGSVQPASGKGPICFSLAAPITITGASQDISANLQAVAPSLINSTGAGTVTHTGALTADQPVFGNGLADIKVGTKTGNTNQVATWSGPTTAARCSHTDAAGNLSITTGDCVTNSAGALTLNAVVLGAGGGDTKVSTGITTDGSSELDLGVNGGAGATLGLNGSTSGKATIVAPAVAGTATNQIVSSNAFTVTPAGAGSSVSYSIAGDANTGFFRNTPGQWTFSSGNTNTQTFRGLTFSLASTGAFSFASTVTSTGTLDTGISRISAGVLGVGTGGQGSVAGTIQAGAYQTGTNCANSGGTCGSAAAGRVSIAAGVTTVTVATTAVTANSEIFIQEDSTLGTALSVTCNTTISRTYAVTTRTAGTSFVITASAAPSTNPACLSYKIVN